MPSPSQNATSGFDLEAILNARVIQKLFHLLADVGDIPVSLNLLGQVLNIQTADKDEIVRNYTHFPGTDLSASGGDQAFAATLLEFDEVEDHFYIQLRVILGLPIDLYVRIRRRFDLQELFTKLKNAADESATFNPATYFEVVGLKNFNDPFDPLDPIGDDVLNIPGNPPTTLPPEPLIDLANMFLQTQINNALTSDDDGIKEFLEGQLDALGLARLDRLVFKPYTESNNLGIYINFILLEHDRGFVGERGNAGNGSDFMGSTSDLGIATGPNFLEHIVVDSILRLVFQSERDSGDLASADVETRLLFDHFPLRLPWAVVEDLTDSELPIDSIAPHINRIKVDTKNKKFEVSPDRELDLDALKITIETDEYFLNAFEIGSENLVLFLAPFTRNLAGRTVLDAFVDINLRVDVLRRFLSPFTWVAAVFTGGIVSPATTSIAGAIVNFVVNSKYKDSLAFSLSETGSEALARLGIRNKRWDPFYITHHGFLLENQSLCVEEERLLLTSDIFLDKWVSPFTRCYVRAYEKQDDEIQALLYKVESVGDIDQDIFFATDRLEFEEVPSDEEPHIFRLLVEEDDNPNTVLARMDSSKLAHNTPFTPYCRDIEDDRIARIGILSDREFDLVRRRLENRLLDELTNELVDLMVAVLESLGIEDTAGPRQEWFNQIRPLKKEDPRYKEYIDGPSEEEALELVKTEFGIIRLIPSPDDLLALENLRSLSVPGYAAVQQEDGTMYYRNIANLFRFDNLLLMPDCPPPPA
ncbi:MAG: hypothetical protein AAGA96_08015 [Verrucomicrobiota bacterium]